MYAPWLQLLYFTDYYTKAKAQLMLLHVGTLTTGILRIHIWNNGLDYLVETFHWKQRKTVIFHIHKVNVIHFSLPISFLLRKSWSFRMKKQMKSVLMLQYIYCNVLTLLITVTANRVHFQCRIQRIDVQTELKLKLHISASNVLNLEYNLLYTLKHNAVSIAFNQYEKLSIRMREAVLCKNSWSECGFQSQRAND